VVAPGECLWSIAADHLQRPSPQRVAAAWPRWYAANRAVIGTDPNHIVAGEVLIPPTHHTEKGSS
jgi:nucleoid-associated protein YgaU